LFYYSKYLLNELAQENNMPSKDLKPVVGQVEMSVALEAIIEFSATGSYHDFVVMFGALKGEHLWERYIEHEYNIIRTYARMDSDAQKKLAARLSAATGIAKK
jgi:hypothetical protein